jgi:uncharacterized protein YbjT (DUF2867 family)
VLDTSLAQMAALAAPAATLSSRRPRCLAARDRRRVRAFARAATSTRRVASDDAPSRDAEPEPIVEIGVGVGRRRALLLSTAALASTLPFADASPALAAALASPSDGVVLVVGATGATGRRVVAQLRAKGFAVRAGSRDVKKASSLGLAASGAELVQLDVLDPSSIAAAMSGVSAVVCATGFTPSFNIKRDNPAKVDHEGTDNLVAAATAPGSDVKKFVLVTSLLTNAKAAGQKDNDNYKFLNALGGVLDEKLAAELNLRASGLDYTVVRPGGLSNEPESAVGNVIVRGEDTTFGLESDPGREISRDTVAAVCVQALLSDKASKRVVEIVASPDAPASAPETWFA